MKIELNISRPESSSAKSSAKDLYQQQQTEAHSLFSTQRKAIISLICSSDHYEERDDEIEREKGAASGPSSAD